MTLRTHTEPLAYRLHMPESAPAALVLDSPHSGTTYPPDFESTVAPGVLRTAEDTWVADLWGDAPTLGVPLIEARFPRAYIDANRNDQEIDQQLLDAPWPEPVPDSPKVRLGKGLIWRLMDDGTPLYERKLSVAEVQYRIDTCWKPYHNIVKQTLDAVHAQHGKVWHINCHSMPSVAGAFATDTPGLVHPDFVLGDRDGATSAPGFREFVGAFLRERGYDVAINAPYKGVELVRRYGDPADNRHSLQLEINRKLYMDEVTLRPSAGYQTIRDLFKDLVIELTAWTSLS